MKKFIMVSIISILSILVVYFLPYGTWSSLGDLPAHPLVVHAVVILLPLISLVLLIAPLKREWLKKWHLPILISLSATTIAVFIAKSSGDSLSAAIGLPEFHAEWGNNLVPVAMALVGVSILYFFFAFYMHNSILELGLRILLSLVSVGAIAMTVVVGHSGAEAVWKDRYAAAKVPIAIGLDEFTAEEVAQHNKASDCWTIVDGFVYDVTSFANRHPAGSEAIREMCGVNASEDFLDEHGGQSEPETWLETLKIGKLK
jgi:hypothetical protein